MLHRKEAARGLENTLIFPRSRPDERKRRAGPLQGKKKAPEHYLLDGVFEKSLAAAYFPT